MTLPPGQLYLMALSQRLKIILYSTEGMPMTVADYPRTVRLTLASAAAGCRLSAAFSAMR